MFIEVDVSEGAQGEIPFAVTRVFDAMEDPVQVSRVMAPDLESDERMCDVTGWSSEIGPCPAHAVLVEDSGEGIAMLIYGGDEGIRLKPVDCQEVWDLNSPHQWGEACLLLDKDIRLG